MKTKKKKSKKEDWELVRKSLRNNINGETQL